jgi:hypothetical protein
LDLDLDLFPCLRVKRAAFRLGGLLDGVPGFERINAALA